MRNTFTLTIAIILLGLSISQAQNNSVKDTLKSDISVDTINKKILDNYKLNLEKSEQQRIEDSIKVSALEQQILTLSTTDEIQKKDLQHQLKELNNRDAKRLAAKRVEIDALRENAQSFPVFGFFNDTLFLVYSDIGHLRASDRAIAMNKRIKELGSIYKFTKDSLEISNTEITSDIVYGEKFIVSLTDDDAIWNNTTKNELAEKYKTIIGNAVVYYQSETSYKQISLGIMKALGVIIVTFLIIFFIIRTFRWSAKKITSQKGKKLTGIKIRHYTLFDAQNQVLALLNLNKLIKWFFILLSIYIALPILFRIFPWTQNLAGTLISNVLSPARKMATNLWNFLPNLITIIIIVTIFRYVIKLFRFLKNEILRRSLSIPGFYPEWATPTFQILRLLTYAFMLVVIFPYLPFSESPIFKGVSVFLGVIFSFGSSGSLSNLIAGIILTYMRLFKIGDRIQIGDITGDVIEKSSLVTRIRTSKNVIISIPNTTVMNSNTINFSTDVANKRLVLHTTVTIGYDVPWKTVHKALIEAADRTEKLLKEPKPFVYQTSLDDFYVSYQINAYSLGANHQASIYSALHSNIQDTFNETGIEILSPHYRAARDGSSSTIPANYLEKDYQAPPFYVNIHTDDKK